MSDTPGPVTLASAAAGIRQGTVAPVELVELALAAAAAHHACNAIACLDPEGALAAAEERTDEVRRGRVRSALHGIPVTVKALFAVDGLPLRAGACAPLPALGPGDAAAVARLRSAGAIVLGTTNMHEIALGITGENPWTGDVRNPWDARHQSGGSSSGAAVSVAVGIGWAALGTDTAGSIRIPASHCGVVGFKPSWGAVPLTGALPLCASCDHAGPLARTVTDAALVYGVLADRPVHLPNPHARPEPVLGVPAGGLPGWLSAGVRAAVERLHARLEAAGARVVEVAVPGLDCAPAIYAPLLRAEAASVHRHALGGRPELFSEPVRRILLEGLEISAVDYVAARQARAALAAEMAAVLRTVDAVVLPATPVPAPRRGSGTVVLESGEVPLREAFLRLSVPFSLTGVPAVALPFATVEGLPVAVQVVGAPNRDVSVLGTARWIEAVLDGRIREPG